jgi:hypothetical protein
LVRTLGAVEGPVAGGKTRGAVVAGGGGVVPETDRGVCVPEEGAVVVVELEDSGTDGDGTGGRSAFAVLG